MDRLLKRVRLWTNLSPLAAAVMAPLSTLLDIPALTQNWFALNGSPVQDQRTSIVLSSVSLAFNFIANGLLFTRFSLHNDWWIWVTRMSVICWFVKVVVALTNVVHYGIVAKKPDFTLEEGFWCATISLLICIAILFLLIAHWIFHHFDGEQAGSPSRGQLEMRVVGRLFMIQNTIFVCAMGVLALFMSRLEHWTYLQGIYFSTITFLTIGFGDFVPTHPATKIVLLPFALIGIVQLGHLISMMAEFLSSRTSSRKAQRHAIFERKRQEQENKALREPDLRREMDFLHHLHRKEDIKDGIRDLAFGLGGVLAFWIVGALIFSQIEGWTYGNGLYFCYIFFLTIGYGDFAPETPAGRVVFIVYSLMVVPIMTSFAVQTITQIVTQLTDQRLEDRQMQLGIGLDFRKLPEGAPAVGGDDREASQRPSKSEDDSNWSAQAFLSHADIVSQHHGAWKERQRKDRERIETTQEEGEGELEKREQQLDRDLTEHVLELAVELERHARKLLIGHMSSGSKAHILLKADQYVQLREVRALAKEMEKTSDGETDTGGRELMRKFVEMDKDSLDFPVEMGEMETLETVWKYRQSFAGLLAAGSRLMKLKGETRYLFERRRKREDDDDSIIAVERQSGSS